MIWQKEPYELTHEPHQLYRRPKSKAWRYSHLASWLRWWSGYWWGLIHTDTHRYIQIHTPSFSLFSVFSLFLSLLFPAFLPFFLSFFFCLVAWVKWRLRYWWALIHTFSLSLFLSPSFSLALFLSLPLSLSLSPSLSFFLFPSFSLPLSLSPAFSLPFSLFYFVIPFSLSFPLSRKREQIEVEVQIEEKRARKGWQNRKREQERDDNIWKESEKGMTK